ncbi:hypothetical protein H4W32_001553 [Actinophytocola algeriensis]|uniref:Uncharacterized protein n=1 Tax=Actinophytocola algeriensis TaxID=1768010 RepID=A0A7W7QE76_9PSEU|nr:hypothetical protein [Actinophytocola algeriensis]MBE1473511.1 hypothetical protein [Actinophytocola algeriensis]
MLGVLLSMDHKQGADLFELLHPARAVPMGRRRVARSCRGPAG